MTLRSSNQGPEPLAMLQRHWAVLQAALLDLQAAREADDAPDIRT